jgi:CheY-like chemotaxis protein
MSNADNSSQRTACDSSRILVADDEEAVVKLFTMVLSSAFPHAVIDCAADGREAVQQFSLRHHAVIVLDLHMPVMDGRAAFSEIGDVCEKKGWEQPRVVFCTGFAPPRAIRQLIGRGSPHRLLAKPVGIEELVHAVKECL